MIARASLALVAVAVTPALVACQSTQSKSAGLEAKSSKVLVSEKGLSVTKQSTDVKVTGTAAFSDVNGAAAVISVKNTSKQDLENVPILIDVRNAKGKSVFKNDTPGIEDALVAIPFIRAGESVDWVHDQVLAAGPVATVKAKVGAVQGAPLPKLPDFEVGKPTLEKDPVSGTQAFGDVINRSGAEQRNLLLYAVARKGGKVVAAGRGQIGRLKATAKPVSYHIYFIGNPEGADISVTAFPSLEKEK